MLLSSLGGPHRRTLVVQCRHLTKRVRRGLHALQPRLSPIRVDLPRGEEPPRAEFSRADDALQLYAVVAEPQHATGVFFDDVGDPPPYLRHSTAERDHLDVESEPAVFGLGGER